MNVLHSFTNSTLQSSNDPTISPTVKLKPTILPSESSFTTSTYTPSYIPSIDSTIKPNYIPSYEPSVSPIDFPSVTPSNQPLLIPTYEPSAKHSFEPSISPIHLSIPSFEPSIHPISEPSTPPSIRPTIIPSLKPTTEPSFLPTCTPSEQPTVKPSVIPSLTPSHTPSEEPSYIPSLIPSITPSLVPSIQPTPSRSPSEDPTTEPSAIPSYMSSITPIIAPSLMPSLQPSTMPSDIPTTEPSIEPSSTPSFMPSVNPSTEPSLIPSSQPSTVPSYVPSIEPTMEPSFIPSLQPIIAPTSIPSVAPSAEPSLQPTSEPSGTPSSSPSFEPTTEPSVTPSMIPSIAPSAEPSVTPTIEPTGTPSCVPSILPSVEPSYFPSAEPSFAPTYVPTYVPTITPSFIPSRTPTISPTNRLIVNRNAYQKFSPWNHFGGTDNMNGFRSLYVGSNTNATRCNYQLDNVINSSPVIAADGTIYIGSSATFSTPLNSNYFYALNPTCTIKWKSPAMGSFDTNTAAIGADGTVYIGSADRNLYAFEPTTGSIVWKRQLVGEIHSSAIIGNNGTIYIGDTSSNFYALSSSGAMIWNVTTATPTIRASPAISLDNRTIFVISYSPTDGSTIYALEVARPSNYGSIKWTSRRPNQIQATPSIGPDGTLYVGSFSFYLNAIDPKTGSNKWRYQAQSSIQSSAAIDDEGTIYFGCNDNNLYAISPLGTLKWTYRTGGPITSTPVVDNSDNVYVGSNDNNLYALTPAGTLKWVFQTSGDIQSTVAIATDGTIYVGSADYSVYAINYPFPTAFPTLAPTAPTYVPTASPLSPTYMPSDVPTLHPTNGTLTVSPSFVPTKQQRTSAPTTALAGYQANAPWPHYRGIFNNNTGISNLLGSATNNVKCTFQLGGEITSTAAVAADGTIYIGTTGNPAGDALYALLPSCTRKWKNSLVGSIDFSSAAIGADGTVYIGSVDKNLYAIEPTLGNIVWKRQLAGEIHSSPTIGNDGSIYITAYGGNLYSFTSSGSLKWTFAVGGNTKSTAAIWNNGTDVIIACGSQSCYSIAARTGNATLIFKHNAVISNSPTLGSQGEIYIGSLDGYFTSYNSLGAQLWQFPTNAVVYSTAVIDHNGTIYIGSADSSVYAISPQGSQLWRFVTNHVIKSSPTLDANGILYVGTATNINTPSTFPNLFFSRVIDINGLMFALNSRTGKVVWEWDSTLTGEYFTGDAVIGPGNTNYVGTSKQFMIFGGVSTSSPTVGATPIPTAYATTVSPSSASPTLSYQKVLKIGVQQTIQGAAATAFDTASAKLTWIQTVKHFITFNITVNIMQVLDIPASTVILTARRKTTTRAPTRTPNSNVPSRVPTVAPKVSLTRTRTTDMRKQTEFHSTEAVCVVYYTISVPYAVADPNQPMKTFVTIQKQLNNSVSSGDFESFLNNQATDNKVPELEVVTVTQTPVYSTTPLSFPPTSSPSVIPTTGSFVPTSSPSLEQLPTNQPTLSSVSTSSSPSTSPVTQAPVTSDITTAGLGTGAIIGISVSFGFIILLVIIGCCYYFVEKKGFISSEHEDSFFSARSMTESPRKPKSSHHGGYSTSVETYYEYDIDENTNSLLIKRNVLPFKNAVFMNSRSVHKGAASIKLKLDGTVHNINRHKVKIAKIAWNDLHILTEDPNDSIIGKGSFGTVYRAVYSKMNDVDVVVKVLKTSGSSTKDDENLFKMAFQECRLMKEAECQMIYQDSIVKVYGIADGELPGPIAASINVQSAIGIVMRYEGGGALSRRLYPRNGNNPGSRSDSQNSTSRPNSMIRHPATPRGSGDYYMPMDLTERIRIIMGIARCLLAIHSVGIVHGDIKPDNILLSSDNPPEVRLADFGLARMNVDEGNAIGASSLHHTKVTKGTMLYCAPEMIANPYEISTTTSVAKASRKSDMYAFALVAWEVLTGLKPFSEVNTEIMLASMLHKGLRPEISKIPSECPQKIVEMVKSCWDFDRSIRASAMKCYSILQFEYSLLTNAHDEVCLTYHSSNHKICEFYYQRLVQLGLKVTILRKRDAEHFPLESHATSVSRRADNDSMLANSRVVVAFINQEFQRDEDCLLDLRKSRSSAHLRPIIAVFTEPDYEKWTNGELSYSCQLLAEGQKFWDVSSVILPAGTPTSDHGVMGLEPNQVMVDLDSSDVDNQIPFFSEEGLLSSDGMNSSAHVARSPVEMILNESTSNHNSLNNSAVALATMASPRRKFHSNKDGILSRMIKDSKHSIYSEEISESDYESYNIAYGVYIKELYDHIKDLLEKQIAKTREKISDETQFLSNPRNLMFSTDTVNTKVSSSVTTSVNEMESQSSSRTFKHSQNSQTRTFANMITRSILRKPNSKSNSMEMPPFSPIKKSTSFVINENEHENDGDVYDFKNNGDSNKDNADSRYIVHVNDEGNQKF